MSHGGRSSVLPLRPLTTAELLDAAVMLLREYGRVLLPVAAMLAALEQALVMVPLRLDMGAHLPFYQSSADSIGTYWIIFAIGCGTEGAVLVMLGGLTARAAAASVLGQHLSARELLRPRGGRFFAVLAVAILVGLLTYLAALLVPVWLLAYASFGLIVPALVVDRLGVPRALVRGLGLAWRNGARAAGIRLLGYVAWLAFRVALAIGGLTLLEAASIDTREWAVPAGFLLWLLVNTVAYPSLACLDAVLHLETRMRTEGLDIWLSRAGQHGPLTPRLLAVHR